MNTYETMKHNIPEGATHYIEGEFYFFVWVNLSKGTYYKEGEWLKYNFSSLPDYVVKSIPVVTLEEEEVVEALEKAMQEMNSTYRYEKVEFELLSDLVVACESGDVFYCENTGGDKNELCMYGAISMHRHSDSLYRRIEVTERELFIKVMYEKGNESGMELCKDHLGWQYDVGCRFVNVKG